MRLLSEWVSDNSLAEWLDKDSFLVNEDRALWKKKKGRTEESPSGGSQGTDGRTMCRPQIGIAEPKPTLKRRRTVWAPVWAMLYKIKDPKHYVRVGDLKELCEHLWAVQYEKDHKHHVRWAI